MNGSATYRIVEGEPIPEGTRVAFTAGDGFVVDAPGTVVRYHSLSNPIVEVVLDDGSHWLAQPWHLKAIPATIREGGQSQDGCRPSRPACGG